MSNVEQALPKLDTIKVVSGFNVFICCLHLNELFDLWFKWDKNFETSIIFICSRAKRFFVARVETSPLKSLDPNKLQTSWNIIKFEMLALIIDNSLLIHTVLFLITQWWTSIKHQYNSSCCCNICIETIIWFSENLREILRHKFTQTISLISLAFDRIYKEASLNSSKLFKTFFLWRQINLNPKLRKKPISDPSSSIERP